MKNENNNGVTQDNNLEKDATTSNPIEVKTFNSDLFGSLRTAYDQFGRPVVCLKDACTILDIKNPSDAKTRLKADGIVRLAKTDGSKFHNYLYITEGNLYRLIFQSRKQEADQFMDWVTEIVLPSIRKYGRYDVRQITGSPEAAIAFLDSYNELRIRNNVLESINEETIEAREYVKRMTDSGVLTDLFDVPAKLHIKGINKVTLLSLLRNNNILNENNLPYQEYIDNGWFRPIASTYPDKKAGQVTHHRVFCYKVAINGMRRLIEKWAGKK